MKYHQQPKQCKYKHKKNISLRSLRDSLMSSLTFMIEIILPSLRTLTNLSNEKSCNIDPLLSLNRNVPIESKGIVANRSIQNLNLI